jgi:hypothetical protein
VAQSSYCVSKLYTRIFIRYGLNLQNLNCESRHLPTPKIPSSLALPRDPIRVPKNGVDYRKTWETRGARFPAFIVSFEICLRSTTQTGIVNTATKTTLDCAYTVCKSRGTLLPSRREMAFVMTVSRTWLRSKNGGNASVGDMRTECK